MPGIAAMRCTSATASSTLMAGTSAAPPKRSGAYPQNDGEVVVVDAGHREVELAVGRSRRPSRARSGNSSSASMPSRSSASTRALAS